MLKIYPHNIEEILDFDKIRDILLKQVYCSEGAEFLRNQSFFIDKELLSNELKSIQELKDIFLIGDSFSTLSFVTIQDVLQIFEVEGASLNVDQLFRLYNLIKGMYDLHQFFTKKERIEAFPKVSAIFLAIQVNKKTYQQIEEILDINKVEIKSNASQELIRIRTKLTKLEKTRESIFNTTLKDYHQSGWLADQKESWRNGKRVLAVLSEFKRKVAGIVLDISGNEKITFIEPVAIQSINSELSEWLILEKKEISRILKQITSDLLPFIDHFKIYKDSMAQLDAWQAKSKLSLLQDAILPTITSDVILLKQARHPVLQDHFKQINRKIVPLDVQLDARNHVLVISGPNAGGKSIAMKTVGLLQLMFQFGLHIPTDEGSKMIIFQKLMANIGDDQSLEDDLSTYSSHLVKMRYFTEQADQTTLFLIDEMGSGTDPAFGGPIAESILEYLTDKKAFGIVTTHYSNLKEVAARKAGIQNAAMSFELNQLLPSYELHIGQAGSSYAFEVAAKSGLPKHILVAAQSKLGSSKKNVELSLSQIQSEKQYLKGIRKNNQNQTKHLEKLIADYENMKVNFEKQKKKLIREYEEKLLKNYNEANRILENEVRDRKENKISSEDIKKVREKIDHQRQKLAENLRNHTIQPIHENKDPIIVGSIVRMEDSNKLGKVTEIRKEKAIVQFGNINSTIPINMLIHCQEEVANNINSKHYDSSELVDKSKFNLDLDIRGKYKEEAITDLEIFLDRAVMYGIDNVRIIHGKGGGVLKQTVQQYLKKYPFIKSYRNESAEFGGDGVTLIELS